MSSNRPRRRALSISSWKAFRAKASSEADGPDAGTTGFGAGAARGDSSGAGAAASVGGGDVSGDVADATDAERSECVVAVAGNHQETKTAAHTTTATPIRTAAYFL